MLNLTVSGWIIFSTHLNASRLRRHGRNKFLIATNSRSFNRRGYRNKTEISKNKSFYELSIQSKVTD